VVYRTKLTEDSIVIDIMNKESVVKAIRKVTPDIIVNCIGILIRGSKEYPSNAIYINAYFPHVLKKTADEIGAKLIHMSTDCVFSGQKGNYTETDFRDADDIYGRSKALGEIINNKDLTIRTSIVGPELKRDGEGLFHWFMNQQGTINGYKTAIWGGVTTLELAKAIDTVIGQDIAGLVHLSNGTRITKYDLLCLFKDIWKKNDVIINPFDGQEINKSIAKSNRFDYMVPEYKQMFYEQYQWMQEHSNLYHQLYPIGE
jgi:dTDP-4-dehydrorhamnose reductase